MSEITRFTVSLESDLLAKFDKKIEKQGYPTRSEAIKSLIRNNLIEQEWHRGGEVAGTVTLVYDHHKSNLVPDLLRVQHDYGKVILASQHLHLDHDNCLEVIVVKGEVGSIESLTSDLTAIKGIKHCQLTMTTTGQEV